MFANHKLSKAMSQTFTELNLGKIPDVWDIFCETRLYGARVLTCVVLQGEARTLRGQAMWQ